MKVLHATGPFLPTKGGGPYFVHYLTQHLAEKGDDCLIVTTGYGKTTDVETVPVKRARSQTVAGFPVSPTYPLVLRRALKTFNPDIIHTHYPLFFFPTSRPYWVRSIGYRFS